MEYKTKYQESMRDLQNQLRQAQNVSQNLIDNFALSYIILCISIYLFIFFL